MSISFSATNAGICEQARSLAGVDSTQWPTQKVVNSSNNWHDLVTGYAIGADRRFQWDDTNQTELPEGVTDLTINVTDYSFLTDEQGNSIITLIGISLIDSNGKEMPLSPIDRNDSTYDISSFGKFSGTPSKYDKIADNVVRLDMKPPATVTGGLKFYFQRTGSYFTSSDTTKSPGVSPLLHRGYVIASAYDIALTLGLSNLNGLAVERQKEEEKVKSYFSIRSRDERTRMTMGKILYI